MSTAPLANVCHPAATEMTLRDLLLKIVIAVNKRLRDLTSSSFSAHG